MTFEFICDTIGKGSGPGDGGKSVDLLQECLKNKCGSSAKSSAIDLPTTTAASVPHHHNHRHKNRASPHHRHEALSLSFDHSRAGGDDNDVVAN